MTREISPLDGRYASRLERLGDYFSEAALVEARVRVEIAWLRAQEETGCWPALDAGELGRMAGVTALTDEDLAQVRRIEARTRHDVKAVEIFLRERLALRDPNRVHFGLTSEDVNNLAFGMMFRDYRDREQIPALERLMGTLYRMTRDLKAAPMPARTHGQKASPTTAGKEAAVFLSRLLRQHGRLKELVFRGKQSGATGTWSALIAAFPRVDWPAHADRFVRELGFLPNLATTQIEDHDTWAEYLDITRRIASVLIDLDRDLWMYLMLGYFREIPEEGQVGSSTMPHKVNPIRFENSEGNLELATGMLATLADKLTRARMQRDLSDSTVTRNVGVALAHVHLAMAETDAGLRRVEWNEAHCLAELDASPELLAEPVQTMLKAAGLGGDPYEQLRKLSRGRPVTREEMVAMADALEIDASWKERIRALRVRDYTGAAPWVCETVLEAARAAVPGIEATR